MIGVPRTFAIGLLRWTLGVVVFLQSASVLLRPGLHHAGPLAGVATFVRALAAVEAAGAGMMLLPVTRRAGAGLLLGVFAVAVTYHVAHREWNVGALLVDAAATLVVLTQAP